MSEAIQLTAKELGVSTNIPSEVSEFYKLVASGRIQKLTSFELIIDDTTYNEWTGTPFPVEGLEVGSSGEKIKIIAENSLQPGTILPEQVALSAGFHDCTAVLWKRGETAYFVHNSGDEPSVTLRAHVIATLQSELTFQDRKQMMQALAERVDETLLQSNVFDQVIIIAKNPEEIAAYFAAASKSVTIHPVTEKDGIEEGKNFAVWMQNGTEEITWGVLPHKS